MITPPSNRPESCVPIEVLFVPGKDTERTENAASTPRKTVFRSHISP